jgi:tRNA(adenine34) deaminase
MLLLLVSTGRGFLLQPPPLRPRPVRSCCQGQQHHDHVASTRAVVVSNAAAAAAADPDSQDQASTAEHELHYRYMALALEQAEAAAAAGEIPVGAVLVSPGGEVLSVGRNRVEATGDASAHAEMECLRAASASRTREEGHWRMLDCTLYVTLEPCLMCLGAIQGFRVRRVIYGAKNHLLGAVESYLPVLERPHPFHQVEARGGVRAEECGALMKTFFRSRRRDCK